MRQTPSGKQGCDILKNIRAMRQRRLMTETKMRVEQRWRGVPTNITGKVLAKIEWPSKSHEGI
jgi:hypothetical protein